MDENKLIKRFGLKKKDVNSCARTEPFYWFRPLFQGFQGQDFEITSRSPPNYLETQTRYDSTAVARAEIGEMSKNNGLCLFVDLIHMKE